ncbi:hypothetical protein QTP88_002067 [Uroleucon formosanum]
MNGVPRKPLGSTKGSLEHNLGTAKLDHDQGVYIIIVLFRSALCNDLCRTEGQSVMKTEAPDYSSADSEPARARYRLRARSDSSNGYRHQMHNR